MEVDVEGEALTIVTGGVVFTAIVADATGLTFVKQVYQACLMPACEKFDELHT